LADLGLARALRPGDATVFEQKAVVGTPGYMAPEQTFDAYNVDFRADVFGLGATLYHAMAGEAPFPLKDKKRAIELTRNAMPLSLSERLPGFPKPVEQLLFQMLAKRPEDRAASWDTVLSEFRSALSGLPI
jgi:serine/threonine protein kinase